MNKKTNENQLRKETMVEFRSMSSRLHIFSSSCILISSQIDLIATFRVQHTYERQRQTDRQTDTHAHAHSSRRERKRKMKIKTTTNRLLVRQSHKYSPCTAHGISSLNRISNEWDKKTCLFFNRNTCSSAKSLFFFIIPLHSNAREEREREASS